MERNWKRIVVKVGTSTICRDNGTLNLRRIDRLARTLSDLNHSGHEMVLVTSGATIAGMQKVNLVKRPDTTAGKQAVAAIGQCELMSVYDRCFMDYGVITGQILLTKDITEEADSRKNAVATFSQLLSMHAVPIVNENDSVSTYEFHYGDNDTLSAVVASLIDADGLIILSDIDGLYDSDPTENKHARMIHTVHEITPEIIAMASGSHTSQGTGGFVTKLRAAKIALAHGIPATVVNGEDPEIIYDLLEGKSIGTDFVPKKKAL